MKLTDKDYEKIAAEIEKGEGYVEYEKEGETLCIDYSYETDGYVEDDSRCGYERGTGAWVETFRELHINKAFSFNEDGDDTLTILDGERLEKQIA